MELEVQANVLEACVWMIRKDIACWSSSLLAALLQFSTPRTVVTGLVEVGEVQALCLSPALLALDATGAFAGSYIE